MADLSDTIETAATDGIKRSKNAAEEVEAHSLPDLIAADEHLKANEAVAGTKRGLNFMRFKPPGTT